LRVTGRCCVDSFCVETKRLEIGRDVLRRLSVPVWAAILAAVIVLVGALAVASRESSRANTARDRLKKTEARVAALGFDVKQAQDAQRIAEASAASLSSELSSVRARLTTTTTATITTLATSAPTPRTTIGEGTFRVGVDIEPGTYTALGTSRDCYWKRLSNFTGVNDIIANHLAPGPATVTILPTDAGFVTNSCGTWTKT
jgi:hypothetical protein